MREVSPTHSDRRNYPVLMDDCDGVKVANFIDVKVMFDEKRSRVKKDCKMARYSCW